MPAERATNTVGSNPRSLPKAPTGIPGLDEITCGGLPSRRTTLAMGSPGCGKTMLALQFIAEGAQTGHPGVYVSVDQPRDPILSDALSAGHDLEALEGDNRIAILPVDLLGQQVTESGSYTLDGLLWAVDRAAKKIGAERLAIDGLDGLFSRLHDRTQVRGELVRLSREFSERGLTTLITAGLPDEGHRLEEYLSDCVILLDHRVRDQVSTRRLRILKYRGTAHGADEYPFSITSRGIRVFPITSAELDYQASDSMVSLGVPDLDEMLGGQGIYRGSAVLMAGQTGTGKTTLACTAAAAAARAGLKCTLFSFEESPDQLRRNLRTVGLGLRDVEESGRLTVKANRPSVRGLEQHLSALFDDAVEHEADLVVVDPITNLVSVGSNLEVKAMLTRLLDGLKNRQITVLLSSLILSGDESFGADIGISSLMDTILFLEHRVVDNTRRRFLSVIKARGLGHSRDIREIEIDANGIRLRPFGGGTAKGSPS